MTLLIFITIQVNRTVLTLLTHQVSRKGFKAYLENPVKWHSASLIIKCANALKHCVSLDSSVMEHCCQSPTFTCPSTISLRRVFIHSLFPTLRVRHEGTDLKEKPKSQVAAVGSAVCVCVCVCCSEGSALLPVSEKYISAFMPRHDACLLNISKWEYSSHPFFAVDVGKTQSKKCSGKRFWFTLKKK